MSGDRTPTEGARAFFEGCRAGRWAVGTGARIVGSFLVDLLRGESLHRDVDLAFDTFLGYQRYLRRLAAHRQSFTPLGPFRAHVRLDAQDYDLSVAHGARLPFGEIYLLSFAESGVVGFQSPAAARRALGPDRDLNDVCADVARRHCRLLVGSQTESYYDKVPAYLARGWTLEAPVHAPWLGRLIARLAEGERVARTHRQGFDVDFHLAK